MSENKNKKIKAVEDAVARIKDATGIIITNYQGLTVERINKLRRELEKSGAEYKVIKNTLSKKALEQLNINGGLKGLFTGVTGLVFCKDYIKASKTLAVFEKENEKFKIKGGYIEHKSYSMEQIMELSRVSSKEELISKLVILLNQPIQRFVNVMSSPKKGVVQVLKSVADKK